VRLASTQPQLVLTMSPLALSVQPANILMKVEQTLKYFVQIATWGNIPPHPAPHRSLSALNALQAHIRKNLQQSQCRGACIAVRGHGPMSAVQLMSRHASTVQLVITQVRLV